MADITLTGNATDAAELRFTPSGQAVLNFSVAENHSKKQGDQFIEDGVTFYRVAVWGKKAETLAGTINKGTRVLVSGRFRSGEFQGREGNTVKTYEVTANYVGIVPKPEPQSGGYQQAQQGGYASQESGWGQQQGATEWNAPQGSSAPF